MSLYLIRYGELALKSKPVRNRMESLLISNIRNACSRQKIPCALTRFFGRIFLNSSHDQMPDLLRTIFGIVSFSPVLQTIATKEAITNAALTLTKKPFTTFAVKTRRVGKHPFSSQDMSRHVGSAIEGKVNLSKPELLLEIEIRDQKAYLFTKRIPGQGGFPLGSQGSVACPLATERDMIAAWLFMKRGCTPVLITSDPKKAALLEKWAQRPLSRYSSYEEAKKKERLLGIVTSDMQSKELPHYDPLLGRSKEEIQSLKCALENPFPSRNTGE